MLLHLRWVNQRYQPHQIYITENGCPDPGHTQYAWTVDDSYRISLPASTVKATPSLIDYDLLGQPVSGNIVCLDTLQESVFESV
ncbi:unnamed protein product [Symbiodinium microadriaticum]|nr:unnamed protein product [Symbiodinium microadriaticum]